MAKPICIIYFPNDFIASGDRHWIYEYMRYLNGEQSDGNRTWGERKGYWNEYYWFCFWKNGIDEPQLKVFHEKDFTDIQFEELKELINQSIQEIKTNNDGKI